MELRHLRYFTALADELNFTRAARSVHVTQSTLSHQIKQLETEIGHRLFDRIGKRIVITDAGEQLLGRVKHALSEIDEGLRALRGITQQLSGNLRIGVTHTFNVSLLPSCIDTFFQKYPSVRVTVHEQSAEAVARGIDAMNYDIGIAYRPPNMSSISFEPLCNDEMALVVSPEHPFASRKRVRMSELHKQDLILSTKETTTRNLLDEWFRSVGAEPVVVIEMNAIAPVLALVRRIRIAAIISRQALTEVDDLSIIPIENPTPLRTPGILWNRNQQPTVEAKSFAVIVRNAVVGTRMTPAATPRFGAWVAQREAAQSCRGSRRSEWWSCRRRSPAGDRADRRAGNGPQHCAHGRSLPGRGYSICPMVCTTLPHLLISSRTKTSNSCRVPDSGL